MNKLKSFYTEEDGAVTVDWVVLTAAIVGLCALIASAMQTGALGLANTLSDFMSNWTF